MPAGRVALPPRNWSCQLLPGKLSIPDPVTV